MTTYSNAQWKASRFFGANKTEYSVYLQTKSSYPIGKEDVLTLIDILSSYQWEEKPGNEETAICIEEIAGGGWQYYHYYTENYYISVTHPDKREVKIRINTGGFGKDEFAITDTNNKTCGLLKTDGRLSDDDLNKIKQLFLNNVDDFNSISFDAKEKVKIALVFSFYSVFSGLEIPPVYLDEKDKREFVRLYNSAWNNNAASGGGIPLFTIHLYNSNTTISYQNKSFLCEDLFHILEFKEKDKKAFVQLIDHSLKGHNGKGEKILVNQNKLVYQYKDGVLDGSAKTYLPDGTLINELKYDNGIPVTYIIYSEEGKKIKEFHFCKEEYFASWTEYETNGDIKKQGKTYYKPFYHSQSEINKFYEGE